MTIYAIANQEDLLLCGAALRIASRMLAGPLQGIPRPLVKALSPLDVTAISGGAQSHFPILVDISASDGVGHMSDSIPLVRVNAFVFRSEDERDRIAFVRAGDVRLDSVPTLVRPELFADSSTVNSGLFQATVKNDFFAGSNRLSGALCGLFHVLANRPESTEAAAGLLGLQSATNDLNLVELLPDVTATRKLRGEAALFVACARTIVGARERRESDLGRIADLLVSESKSLGKPEQSRVMQWRTWLQPRLDYQSPLLPGDLVDPTEKGSQVLRAMTMLLFREHLVDLVEADRSQEHRPGMRVSLLAGTLAGLRDGLASIDIGIKAPQQDWIADIACRLDADIDAFTHLGKAFEYSVSRQQGKKASRILHRPSGRVVSEVIEAELTLLQRILQMLRASGMDVRLSPEGASVHSGDEAVFLSEPAAPRDSASPSQTVLPEPKAVVENGGAAKPGRKRAARVKKLPIVSSDSVKGVFAEATSVEGEALAAHSAAGNVGDVAAEGEALPREVSSRGRVRTPRLKKVPVVTSERLKSISSAEEIAPVKEVDIAPPSVVAPIKDARPQAGASDRSADGVPSVDQSKTVVQKRSRKKTAEPDLFPDHSGEEID